MTEREPQNRFSAQLARIAVGTYDDAQDVRKETMNRVRDLVRKKREGIPFDQTEGEKDDDDRSRGEYSDENLPEIIEEMEAGGTLDATDRRYLDEMLEIAADAQAVEERAKAMLKLTEDEPIFDQWLVNVYGVSTTLTARMIHRVGYCEKFDRVSQLWSYCGMAPGQERKRGQRAGFDPQAKTVAWLVADNMIRQASNSRYRTEFYDPYKDEQVRRAENSVCDHCGETTFDHGTDDDGNNVCDDGTVVELSDFTITGYDADDGATPPWSQGHADARARRYLAKKFLKSYWYIARDIKGLETPDEYIVAYGGHKKRTDTFENPAHQRRVLKNR